MPSDIQYSATNSTTVLDTQYMQCTLVDTKQLCSGLEAAQRVNGMAEQRGGDTVSQSSGRRSGVWWNDDEDTESPSVKHSFSTAKWRPVNTASLAGFNVNFTLWLVQRSLTCTSSLTEHYHHLPSSDDFYSQFFDYITSLVHCLARSAVYHVHS